MTTQEFKIDGDQLLAKVRELLREANTRKIIIKNQDDKTLLEIPLTVGAVGVVLAPVLAAVGAMAALMTRCTIIVEKE